MKFGFVLFKLFLNHRGIVHVAQSGGFLFGLGFGDPGLGGIENSCVAWKISESGEIWLRCEDAGKVTRQGVFKIQRVDFKQGVDGMRDRAHAAVVMADRPRGYPGAGDCEDTAVRVDVIDAILRIVFGDEESGVLPNRGRRKVGNDPAEGEVVIGNIAGAVGIAVRGARVCGVVAG